jgi:hypothetical protein
MESYIVRVYRRSRTTPGEIAGLVESVETDEKRAFQSFAGLIKSLRDAILPADGVAVDHYGTQTADGNYSSGEKQQAR